MSNKIGSTNLVKLSALRTLKFELDGTEQKITIPGFSTGIKIFCGNVEFKFNNKNSELIYLTKDNINAGEITYSSTEDASFIFKGAGTLAIIVM